MTRSPHKIFTDHFAFLDTIQIESSYGYVSAISGLMLEGSGLTTESSIGTQCIIHTNQDRDIKAQIVGFKNGKALLMAFGPLDGVGIGSKITITQSKSYLFPDQHWLGRVINAFGDPIDELGPLPQGTEPIPLLNTPPPAHQRKRVHRRIDLGVKALNTFIPACEGQRLGIFAGSGVGKSMLMSMLARYTEADVNVIGLVGERGREVQEFLYDDLGEDGLKKSVLVVATSDESPLMRRQAAYTTLAVAEYFRNQGKHVLCIIDNITRFAMAQREIGLSVGEPPTTKGYPPSVYSELPRLLERAGPGLKDQGSITGFFTVLVEGDDFNEPISDTVRGILDGHIILDRKIADRGRYPSIHVLKSISRMLPDCHSDEENELLRIAKKYLSLYEDMSEMIRLGAYRKGSDPDVDKAILYYNDLEDFLTQNYTTYISQQDAFQALSEIIQKYEE
ncbi:MAG: flagellar protein export ATPase FliI [Alphaproteobacteria bacterium]|nr:flagellar protein export ATPase FliI [Alphaproteobacteria bacterium]MBP9877849.1 flagellar protein export ATPase FliI [Alphaproteobacteria bacterium]